MPALARMFVCAVPLYITPSPVVLGPYGIHILVLRQVSEPHSET